MFWLVKSTFPILFSSLVTFFLIKKYNKIQLSKNFLIFFSLIWVFLFISQYTLGIYSPVTFWDNASISLSRIIYENNNFLGGKLLHNLLGGIDYYGSQGSSGQYISFEIFIFKIFPIWFAILFHKIILILVSFFGFYLLSYKTFGNSKINSILAASFFSIINPYSTYVTFLHGITFAIIPLAIYIYLYCCSKKFYFFIALILSAIISTSTSPLHSFPPLLFGIVATSFIKKPKNIKKFLVSISLLFILTILNWSEHLYGLLSYGELSSRFQSEPRNLSILGGFDYLSSKGNSCLIGCEYLKYSPFLIVAFLTLILSLIYFKKDYLKYYFVIFISNYFYLLFNFFVSIFGLESIKSLNFFEISFYLYIPVILLTLEICKNKSLYFQKNLVFIFPFFAFSMMLEDKFDFAKKIFFEPQTSLYKINNLKEKKWLKDKFYRVSSTNPHFFFHPNFVISYGLEASDGYSNLIPKNYTDFWEYGILKKDFSTQEPARFGGDLYLNYKNLLSQEEISRYLKEKVNLDNLKLINNKYILSYVPIKYNELKKVSGPSSVTFKNFSKENKFEFYLKTINEKFNYLGNPPDIYIYELNNVSDRFFYPKKILKIDESLSLDKKFKFMSENYNKNYSFFSQNNFSPGMGVIENFKKIDSGYEINVTTSKAGVFTLNTFYNPFWKVRVNDVDKKIINLENVHIGVNLDEGSNKVVFVYSRKLLRQKIVDFFIN